VNTITATPEHPTSHSRAVVCRAARPAERLRAARLFRLPPDAGEPGDLTVAVSAGTRQRLLAAACILPAPEGGGYQRRARFRWDVRAGDEELAQRLVRATIARATALRFDYLMHQLYVPIDDPRARCLRALGFPVDSRIEEFECSFDAVWNRCRRVYERLDRQRALPADIQLRSLEARLIPAIRTRLHQERIMDTFEFDERLRPDHPEPIDCVRSTAITRDDALLAVMLVAPMAATSGYIVPARWVTPSLRNGWANAALIYHSAKQGLDLGLDRIRFIANSAQHRETMRLATRLGGHCVRSRDRHAIALPT
jgi:hypothetical protein